MWKVRGGEAGEDRGEWDFWEGQLMHKQTHKNTGTSSWMRDETKIREGVEEEGGGMG